MYRLIFVFAMLCFLGCGSNGPNVSLDDNTPLTVQEWKDLDPLVKYNPSTFERIKEGNPKLKNKKAWDRFMVQVVVPERKKDIPSD